MGWIVFDVAVLLGLLAVSSLMGYLGVRVSIHPPATDVEKRKVKYQFLALASIAGILTIIQGVRNGMSEQELARTIKDNPPKVEVTVPAPTVIEQTRQPETNVPLKEKAFALAAKIRKLSGAEKDEEMQSTFRGWGVMLNGTEQEKKELKATDSKNRQDRFQKYLYDYQQHYMRDAITTREELLKKLPPGTRNDELTFDYKQGFGTGSLDKVADDLERLTSLVPDD